MGIFHDAIGYVQQNHPFTMIAYVILPDHMHLIWELPENDSDYPTRIRLFKSYITRHFTNRPIVSNISRQRKGEQEIWQRRYWEHTIRDQHDLNIHIDYIHFNPVKHGYVNATCYGSIRALLDFVKDGIYPLDWATQEQVPLNLDVGGE